MNERYEVTYIVVYAETYECEFEMEESWRREQWQLFELKKRIVRGDDERTSEKEDGVTPLPSLSLSGCNFYDTLYRIFSKRKSWVMDWFN